MRPFLPTAWAALVPSSPLPQPKALLSHPGPKLPPALNTGPELLPPSSFMPCVAEIPARVSPPSHLGSCSLVWPSVLFSHSQCCSHSSTHCFQSTTGSGRWREATHALTK